MRYWLCLWLLIWGSGAEAETFQFVTGNDYAPFTDEKLPQRGMTTELVELIVQEMGASAYMTFLPWKRGYEAAKVGEFMGTFPYVQNEERGHDFYYSEPLHLLLNRVFVRTDFHKPFQQVEDLQGWQGCYPLGYAPPQAIQKMIQSQKIRVEEPVDMEACFKMLSVGRVEFTTINEWTGWKTIEQLEGSRQRFKALDPPLETVGQYLIVSKKHPQATQFLKRFNHTLAQLKEQGRLQSLVERHLQAFHERPAP